jgi:deoxyribodipyrimidine photo-lyase
MTSKETDSDRPALVLFRHDLRIADNRAVVAAAQSGKPIVAAFVLDEESKDMRPIGGARRWWLHHSLERLSRDLKGIGLRLVLRRGAMAKVARQLAKETRADLVTWNRRYDPPAIEADKTMKAALGEDGVACESFEGHLLHEPWQIRTGAGSPYRVYSPFWRAFVDAVDPRAPLDAPKKVRAHGDLPESEKLDDWHLLPTKPDWAGGLRETWTPGEAGAQERLGQFLDEGLRGYADGRDVPGRENTSRLSPHLCHGEITPFQIWHALGRRDGRDAEKFRKELGWREFSWHVLFHNPALHEKNFNDDFDAFPWERDDRRLKLWQQGLTGHPIVDAGMRELWHTGWMHNRVRMIAASFLAKDLLIDWRQGEKWFWDTLVDADPANNPASWQWVAGSGADAAPYFRVFNPVLQGRKFDPQGSYVSRHVPELADLPARYLHSPWEAPEEALRKARVKLGTDYPVPAIDHGQARDRALEAYRSIRGQE